EQDHRAELQIDGAADDQLVAVVADHRLNGYALEGRRFQAALLDVVFQVLLDGRERLANGRVVGQVELNSAGVALVRDGRGIELEPDRVAELASRTHRGVGGGSWNGADHWDVVSRQQFLGFRLGQQRPFLGPGAGDQTANLVGIRRPAFRQRGGRLVEQLLVP